MFELGLNILVSVLAGGFCFYLANNKSFGGVKASALITFSVVILIDFVLKISTPESVHWSALVFGSTFVGMANRSYFTNWSILIPCGIYAIGFTVFSDLFKGIGGSLGALACISCLMVIGAEKLIFYFVKKDSTAKR